tara:strand:+ start:288 stop:539 length:252 start_codon:yes stop_codon:yes gene_type:complete
MTFLIKQGNQYLSAEAATADYISFETKERNALRFKTKEAAVKFGNSNLMGNWGVCGVTLPIFSEYAVSEVSEADFRQQLTNNK